MKRDKITWVEDDGLREILCVRMIEGRVTCHLGRNVEIIESYNKKPVEIVSKIPEKSWSSKDE